MSQPPRDDEQLFDDVSSEERLSVVALPDADAIDAFAGEEQAPVDREFPARIIDERSPMPPTTAATTAQQPPPFARNALRTVVPVAIGAAVVAVAVGAYVHPATRVSPVEQIAGVRYTDVVVTEPVPATVPRSTDEETAREAAPRSAAADEVQTAPEAVSGDSAALSGVWMMNTRVESSRLKRYEGLRLGYRVRLRQNGDRVSGTGWKVSENERPVGTSGQTPIRFEGVMRGDRVELTFTEDGRLRTSGGTLVVARDSHDMLRGRFSSTAARSTGAVEIYR